MTTVALSKTSKDILALCPQQTVSQQTPYSFIENKGQIIDQNQRPNAAVLYQLSLPGLNVSLKNNGFSYDVWMAEDLGEDRIADMINNFDNKPALHKYNYKFHRIDIDFLGASPDCKLETKGKIPDYLMYYTTGTPEEGVKVHHYEKVYYRNLYNGIDLEFVAAPGTNKPVEYNFIIHPGADISQIKMQYKGAFNFELKEGALVLKLAHTELKECIPASWIEETREQLQVNYKRLAQDKHSITLGFVTTSFNADNTLIIDPIPTLNWSTYYGQSSFEFDGKVTTDLLGNVLVTGITSSGFGMATSGAYQVTLGGVRDAFILKLNSNGSRQWATYYGGAGDDQGLGIVADSSGNVLVTGFTTSNNGIVTTGALQTIFGGIIDAFIVKFNSSGVRQWGTYYGGTDFDYGYAITTDMSGNLYFTGRTKSTSGIASIGAYQTNLGGNGDGYIVKLNSAGILQWGTYYGGPGDEHSNDIEIDNSGNILITGATISSTNISTIGAHQTIYGGNIDAFIVKFNSSGTLQWGTYYGGAGDDQGSCIAVDALGNVLVSGYTSSLSGIAVQGAHQTILGGNDDAFIVKLFSSGTLYWGTYYGGTGVDYVKGIITDALDNVIVIGVTNSITGIATTGSYQSFLRGDFDAFIVKFNAWSVRQWGSYFGGTEDDFGTGVAIDVSGNVLVSGYTYSSTNIATSGSHQILFGGSTDAFIAKFSTTNVGLNEIINDNLFFLYPNPTQHVVNVQTETKFIGSIYIVYDNTGRIVLTGKISDEITSIDMGELSGGIYLISLGENMKQSFKVIKE